MTTSPLAAADRYRLVFEHLSFGIIVFDTEYNVLDCNDALASLLHSTRQRVVGLNFLKIPDQRIVPAITESLAGRSATYQGLYRSATSGDEIIALFRCIPLHDERGAVVGGFGVAEDATQRIHTEEQLRAQIEVMEVQAETIRMLGAPILRVWDSVLCLPLIGEVDPRRAAAITEQLLRAIIHDAARFAIVDLTGVETLGAETAEHVANLARAAALVGTELVVCGIRPNVALQVVDLDLDGVPKVRTLQDALQRCIEKLAS
jgi:rsbT co-antagonist protein RsbR